MTPAEALESAKRMQEQPHIHFDPKTCRRIIAGLMEIVEPAPESDAQLAAEWNLPE